MSNLKAYQAHDVVQEYAAAMHLQKSEQAILKLLEGRLSRMSMLDIGVGGGRTTLHFARLVQRYVGIDFSDTMVQACRERFAGWPDHVSFATGDARDLSAFPDETFDFVLFSFNGIDYMSHGDRLATLAEIRRVGKCGGLFCFSTHNLQSLPNRLSLRRCLSAGFRNLGSEILYWARLRLANPGVTARSLLQRSYGIYNDGAHDFRLKTYYIRPDEQIRQLGTFFDDIAIFEKSTGNRIEDPSAWGSTTDPWIYYLCTMK